ncbi:2,3-bisphosphoglycerate-dependent phosphoglycerate mutase [Rhizobium chutanense]|uniref:2,3-bisphosphoglycerate-dependent phosphoglycerate mutase n=1 Tax=Rhizobium chutanense TaxID=2035448 RepID=A0A2A6J6L9_9HYPH|nr:2,3-bisphosphoglycerate-dependent phosphoglycerate mutase [Rhizobium chutanense]PDT01641.1 2,3-bisphosphoglycerate-dependent phosphoglycerate mutase [Rhizobium chutanense]RUM01169.1 2,3-bisphosphoglycerate-dependent phosphoglycerate mutase [Rhizobium chutanense]
MSTLVVVRHGQSSGNERNEFTGWRDEPLTRLGLEESRLAGMMLGDRGLRFDKAFSSNLSRAVETCRIILSETNDTPVTPMRSDALNERDYGELTGLNKDDAREKWGPDLVRLWRRSYLVPPPGGESIRDTSARVLPFIICEVLPALLRGKSVLLVSHGNTMRTICHVIEKLSIEQMLALEIPTAMPTIYRLTHDLSVIEKAILSREER